MYIKEIVLEAGHSTVPAYWLSDEKPIVCSTSNFERLASFAEAIIESYKAELLKAVGEPVLYAEFTEDGGWLGDASEYADHLEEPHALYTSDQLVAAVLKATKPLEERRCEICGYAEHHREHTGCLRTQLAAAQEENGRLENQVLARDAELWSRTQEILGLKDQLAKAEQRVAEACALQVATETRFHWLDAARVAKEIRSGEWRKFVKEVL